MNSYQTLNSKLNIDEPLKAIKVIDFLFFFFCSWINRHHSSWLLAYCPAIALKAAAAESDADLTCILFSDNSTFSDPLQVSSIERKILKPFQSSFLWLKASITDINTTDVS